MAEQMPPMTKDEFREYVDESFMNGTEAALKSVATFVAELLRKVDEARDSTAAHPDTQHGQGVGE